MIKIIIGRETPPPPPVIKRILVKPNLLAPVRWLGKGVKAVRDEYNKGNK